jgi:nucleotide-binding universal stress UspA family protein
MERFKNILLVLNPESDELVAVARAVTLARQNQARLHVIVVLEHLPLDELPLGTRTLLGMLDRDVLREMIEQRQRGLLRTGLSKLSTEGIDLSTSVEWSHTPFLTVVQRVLRQGHDLVIKTAEHVTGPRSVLFHPTDRHLMRKCPCPVWMIRPEQRHTYQRILAAVDSFPDDEINADLNRHILDLASSQAVHDDAELHVVHAYHVRSNLWLPTDVNVDEYKNAVVALHRERLEALLEAYPLPGQRVHMEEGFPGEVIPAVACRERIDLIVMGTVARVGIPGLFIGNTAERTLDHVDCDILAIKPKGFVTPVQLPDQG